MRIGAEKLFKKCVVNWDASPVSVCLVCFCVCMCDTVKSGYGRLGNILFLLNPCVTAMQLF